LEGKERKVAKRGMNREMMKQLQGLQARIVQAQKQLEETVVEASAGGGAVKVVMNAQPRLISITVEPEVVDPEDVQMLQDLIVVAINEALEKARQSQAQQMAGLTGGLGIPGLILSRAADIMVPAVSSPEVTPS